MGVDQEDDEIAVMATVSSALGRLPDDEARKRVLSYVLARHLPADSARIIPPTPTPQFLPTPKSALPPLSGMESLLAIHPPFGAEEIPGIAQINNGELVITVRDLKAKSGLDAAVRLAFVSIFAHQKLLGRPMSSRKELTPLLKQWRVYDGNTRARLSKEKGILRDGDNLTLDAHARRDAEQVINEILDDDLGGKWKPK